MSTTAGLTVSKFFSPFYSTARRRFRLSASQVDQLLSMGAFATLDGHDLTFTVGPDNGGMVVSQHRFRIRPRMAADWANDFNYRNVKPVRVTS